ncbi:ATP-binding cassette domain-containing protein [Paenibacillus alginolyticus]|uniref:ATP-binding cassette domain-containing protein n=1 Tax=Paenibacillus alginolyticus TaxID=59839 RepID=UPI000407760F|nr:ATP-binding cassette domain-containing protein [Paenibacillus alginolyticus]MCY9666213.1 ATP-binding cassette domain-containing protein [Paenibacillus alginolyticus]
MFSFVRLLCSSFLQYKLQTALLLAALLVELTFETFMPLSYKFIIDLAIVPKQYNLLLLILSLMVSGALASVVVGMYRDRMFAGLGSRIVTNYYKQLFEKLQSLSTDFFHRINGGDIVSRFNNDLISIDTFIKLIPYALLSILGLILNVAVLFVLQWQLALLAVIGLPLCLIGPKLFGQKAYDASYQLKEEQASIATAVQENVSAQPVIKAFGLQPLMIGRFADRMLQYGKLSTRSSFLSFLIDRTTNLGTMILNLMTICVGSLLAYYGILSIGSLLAFSAILLSLSYLVAAITWLAPQFIEATSGMQRVRELLDEQPSVPSNEQADHLPHFERHIEFRNVTFAYSPEQRSLNGISLTIPKGTFAAFVGASGSGKSTIINLLMRFYDPQMGSVRYDGTDIRQIALQSLRSQIGIVFQESFLFRSSIRENIRLGKPEASDEEVMEAARLAEIHDFIMSLPDGYDTDVGERGGRLSGGQRQRVAIARAIIRNPAILILDEATSALDPSTEAAINKTLQQITATRTVISVTHRLASAEHADCIYVLNQGEVTEQGSHQELLKLPEGRYKQSWTKQTGFDISEDGYHVEVSSGRLKLFPIFSGMDESLLRDISHFFVTESYAKERTIIHEGDLGDKFYIIVRGKVEVLKKNSTGTNDRLAVLSDGDFFGEVALLRNIPRTATIYTLSPVVFITLQREFFQDLMKRAPHLTTFLESRSK